MPPTDYADFRRRLDNVLRQKDSAALQEFLIAEDQWTAESNGSIEGRMWIMIAGSPALRMLHPEAKAWLLAHGYQTQVAAIFGPEADRTAQNAKKQPFHAKRPDASSPGKDSRKKKTGRYK